MGKPISIPELLEKRQDYIDSFDPEQRRDIGGGSIKQEELEALACYLQEKFSGGPATILEIGAFVGLSTRMLSLMLPSARITSVDANFPHRGIDSPLDVARKLAGSEGVQFVEGVSPQAIKGLPASHFDFAWIDGEHEGEQPYMDYMACRELKIPRMGFHDWRTWPDVDNALKRIEREFKGELLVTRLDTSPDGIAFVEQLTASGE